MHQWLETHNCWISFQRSYKYRNVSCSHSYTYCSKMSKYHMLSSYDLLFLFWAECIHNWDRERKLRDDAVVEVWNLLMLVTWYALWFQETSVILFNALGLIEVSTSFYFLFIKSQVPCSRSNMKLSHRKHCFDLLESLSSWNPTLPCKGEEAAPLLIDLRISMKKTM